MTSTRLPGKVLKEVCGKPLLAIQIERLKKSSRAGQVLVATTELPADDSVAQLCSTLGVPVFRGSENDVLGRFYGALDANPCDAIVRVTADCPLIDPEVVDRVISFFERGAYDYASNTRVRTFPRGLDTEIFTADALRKAHAEAKSPSEREHVTPYLYGHPKLFRLGSVENSVDESRHRWTVDVQEDFELVRRVLESLHPTNPNFTMHDVLRLLSEHSDWISLNAHIEQKV